MKVVRLWVGLFLATALSGGLIAITVALQAWETSLAVTLLHAGVGLVLAIGIIPFARHHWCDVRRWKRVGTGSIALLGALGVLLVSGGLLVTGNYRDVATFLHLTSTTLFLVAVIWHLYRWSHTRALWKPILGFLILVVGLVSIATYAFNVTLVPSGTAVVAAAPASFRLTGPLPTFDEVAFAPESCANCHSEITDQWQQSLHAVADTELIYARVVAEFRKDYGVTASNWCAGCHSPLRAARGDLDRQIVDVPQSDVDCIVCHSVTALHDEVGNHGFDLTVIKPTAFNGKEITDTTRWLTAIQPAPHLARWDDEITRKPEFCGSCHRQLLPAFLNDKGAEPVVLQDTYTEWLKSPYNSTNPFVRRTCQDCHMPYITGDATNGRVRSHLMAGANVEVARILGAHDLYPAQESLLQQAATLSITSSACETETLSFEVQVTNVGAGHHLPTGVTDLREVWLEIEAIDWRGGVVWSSGVVGEDGVLPDNTVLFGTVLGDVNGNPVLLHDIAKVRTILSDTTIAPTETRVVPYRTELPVFAKSLTLQARLLYRVVPQAFISEYISPLLRFRVIPMTEATVTVVCEP